MPEPERAADAVVRTVLVVPCYNEAERLDLDEFRRLLARAADVGLLFVDDGSRDDTADRLSGFAREIADRVEVLRLTPNGGKGEAVRRGMRHALARSPSYVGYWDADLSTPLEEVPRFVRYLDRAPRCEWVIGSRVRLLGRRIERRPLRHYVGRVFATGASVALRLPVYDTQCGAKLFRANERLAACLEHPFRSRWVFDVELLARLQAKTGADADEMSELVHELPLRRWRDVPGSKVTAAAAVRAALELLAIRRRYGGGRPAGRIRTR
jgi:glycosyltransferase involved in cell wall biosynthesis